MEKLAFNDEMVVYGTIKGQKAKTFMDSGSSISLIGGRTFERIKGKVVIEEAEFDNIHVSKLSKLF